MAIDRFGYTDDEETGVVGRLAKTAAGTAEYTGLAVSKPFWQAKEAAESALGIKPISPGVTSAGISQRQEELLPGGPSFEPLIGGALAGAGYQRIANEESRKTSDKIINDWMAGFGVISKERQSPVEPLTAPVVPTPVPAPTPVPTGIVNAPAPSGESYIDRMSRQWEEGGSVPLMQPGGVLTFQKPGQGTAEMEALQTRRDLGLEPKAGMAEYEASAARIRGIKEAPSVVAARIGAVAEQQRANIGYQAKIFESAKKSNEDWAKLGIAAGDAKSKAQYRQAQIDDMMTKTGLIEPFKLQLSQAKNGMEARKIRRDFSMQSFHAIFDPMLKRYENSLMPGIPPTKEQQEEFNKLTEMRTNALKNIDDLNPEEGAIREFDDGIGKFTNGTWVKISNKGVVGGK